MSKIEEIMVDIEREDEKVSIVFKFETDLKIELTGDDREEIKLVFIEILKKLEEESIKFVITEQEENDLFTDTVILYIKTLNSEISSIESVYPREVVSED